LGDARIDGAHDACHDALAAARVAYRIGQRCPTLGKLELATLHERQIGWYREQAQGLQDYWIKKGDPRRVDSFSWPVRELPPVVP
jgi:DNA polymerase-3 subunit epsilon